VASSQRPLELILARNLLSSLRTPAFLANAPGDIVFYNDAAGTLLGRRFEETGAMSADRWVADFGPIDEHGDPVPVGEQQLTHALRANRAAHVRVRIRAIGGTVHEIEATGVPIIGADGFQGAMVFFWAAQEARP
jgi:PAS domain-containing protein